MTKRDAVLGSIERGEPQEYIPAAFFIHFAPAFHTGQAAIDKHLEYFRYTGMDFVKVQYERTFPHQEWLQRPGDWARVPLLGKEFFQPQLDVVEGLVNAVGSEALVVVTLYSPYMCAGHLADQPMLQTHLRENRDAVKKGLQIVTDSLMVFVQECIRLGVDGFYHSTQGAEPGRFADPAVFTECIRPFDLALMEEAKRRCRFNILHVCDYHRDEYGGYDDLTPLLDYPGHVVNINPQIGGKVLSGVEIARLFGRPFMGGMDRKGPLAAGSEAEARAAARAALRQAPSPFILGADCTVPNPSWANLRAAVEEAHRWRAD